MVPIRVFVSGAAALVKDHGNDVVVIQAFKSLLQITECASALAYYEQDAIAALRPESGVGDGQHGG
jgi:hypothetical protein